jgi:hypothetical protein
LNPTLFPDGPWDDLSIRTAAKALVCENETVSRHLLDSLSDIPNRFSSIACRWTAKVGANEIDFCISYTSSRINVLLFVGSSRSLANALNPPTSGPNKVFR